MRHARRLVGLLAVAWGAATPAGAQRADNPHGRSVQGTCIACHKADAWRPAVIARDFRHAPGTFALEGAHATAPCTACHRSLDFSQAPTTCAACHQDVHKGEFGTQCARCHTPRTFTDRAAMAQAHQLGRFPLRGAHAAVACEGCHARAPNGQLQFVNRPSTCVGCHAATARAVKDPDHQAAAFSTTCTECHTLRAWAGATYDHARTRFPLTLGHAGRPCAACHADKVFTGKPMACEGCHLQDYQRTTNPPHAQGFPVQCASCHGTARWAGATFDHGSTRFPLEGNHRALACAQCHGDKVFRGKVSTCIGCHQKDFQASASPRHAAAGFSTECRSCHVMSGWKGATWDHGRTQFPLTGRHVTVPCQGCHADDVYRGKPTACVACHRAAYDGTRAPPHGAAGFPTLCESCHRTTDWRGAPFDHARTRFALTGAHLTATCADCHGDGVFVGKPTACLACHKGDFEGTTRPPHATSGFPGTCETCHTTSTWTAATFDHARTAFPLTGAHRPVPCLECHRGGTYRGLPTACAACHQPAFDASTNPHHGAAGFTTLCAACHTTTAWAGGRYDHAATAFPLTGAHAARPCSACHADKVYKGKPSACVACHQREYDAAVAPPHKSAGLPTTCQTCHGTSGWKGASFDHASTRFPLTGAHRAATCRDCHASGVYTGLPAACASCHQAAYDASTNPHHGAAGFTTLCASCHTTAAWTGGTYNHGATAFPLTGAHVGKPCSACHADKVYKGKPTACVTCHQAAYDATTAPRHATLGFPTMCQTCHGTAQWLGATFNHDGPYFPIYSGEHRGRWTSCAQCHANPGNYKQFTCLSCHPHSDKAKTDGDHRGKSGYQYVSTACYACHPRP